MTKKEKKEIWTAERAGKKKGTEHEDLEMSDALRTTAEWIL